MSLSKWTLEQVEREMIRVQNELNKKNKTGSCAKPLSTPVIILDIK